MTRASAYDTVLCYCLGRFFYIILSDDNTKTYGCVYFTYYGQVAPTSSSSSSSSSVRVRKKVAPTVTTGRPRRSKPDNSNHNQTNRGPVNTSGQVQSTSLADVEMINQSGGGGASVEDPQSGHSLDCQSYTSPQGTYSHGHNVSYCIRVLLTLLFTFFGGM